MVTGITMESSAVFFEFNVNPDSSSFEQTPTVSAENGVAFWEQKVIGVFGKMTASQRNLAKSLIIGSYVVIVLDKNGTYWMVGRNGDADTGMYVNGGSMTTGKSGTDLAGLSLEMYSKTLYPSAEISKALVDTVIETV